MIDSRRQAGAGLWGDRTLHLKQAAQRRQPPTSRHTNRQAAPIALRDGRYAASLIKSRAFRRPVPALSRPAFGPWEMPRACPASSRQPSRRRFHEHACSNQPVDTRTPFTGPDSMSKQPSLSYKDAGVDIDAGEALVERIRAWPNAPHDLRYWAAWAASAPCAKSRQATSSPCWSPVPTASVPNASGAEPEQA